MPDEFADEFSRSNVPYFGGIIVGAEQYPSRVWRKQYTEGAVSALRSKRVFCPIGGIPHRHGITEITHREPPSIRRCLAEIRVLGRIHLLDETRVRRVPNLEGFVRRKHNGAAVIWQLRDAPGYIGSFRQYEHRAARIEIDNLGRTIIMLDKSPGLAAERDLEGSAGKGGFLARLTCKGVEIIDLVPGSDSCGRLLSQYVPVDASFQAADCSWRFDVDARIVNAKSFEVYHHPLLIRRNGDPARVTKYFEQFELSTGNVIQPADPVRCRNSQPCSIGRKLHAERSGFVRLSSCDFPAGV